MKVIKNINNNVAICVDDNGHEVVAMGKELDSQSLHMKLIYQR